MKNICGVYQKNEDQINTCVDNNQKLKNKKVSLQVENGSMSINDEENIHHYKLNTFILSIKNVYIKHHLKHIKLYPFFTSISGADIIQDEEMNNHVSKSVIDLEKKLPPFEIPEDLKNKNLFEAPAIKFQDGSFYKGNWSKNFKKNGYGIYVKEDGAKYEGFWQDDLQNGNGRYFDSKGNYFIGEWKDGKANGKGKLVIEDAIYEGNWVNDIQEGSGSEKYKDGTSYEGEYINGCKHGKGIFKWQDGSYYEGNFEKGAISGKGELKWYDGRKYNGDWKNNKMHGVGTFLWPDGKKYIGEYVMDKKHGNGKYYWNDQKYYEGFWFNSKQHGEGVSYNNGKLKKVIYRFGKRVRDFENEDKENLVLENITDIDHPVEKKQSMSVNALNK